MLLEKKIRIKKLIDSGDIESQKMGKQILANELDSENAMFWYMSLEKHFLELSAKETSAELNKKFKEITGNDRWSLVDNERPATTRVF